MQRLYTAKEVTQRLGINKYTLYKYLKNGDIRGYDLGYWKFSEEQIQDFLASREKKGCP